MKCWKCGLNNPENATQCDCGASLEETEARPTKIPITEIPSSILHLIAFLVGLLSIGCLMWLKWDQFPIGRERSGYIMGFLFASIFFGLVLYYLTGFLLSKKINYQISFGLGIIFMLIYYGVSLTNAYIDKSDKYEEGRLKFEIEKTGKKKGDDDNTVYSSAMTNYMVLDKIDSRHLGIPDQEKLVEDNLEKTILLSDQIIKSKQDFADSIESIIRLSNMSDSRKATFLLEFKSDFEKALSKTKVMLGKNRALLIQQKGIWQFLVVNKSKYGFQDGKILFGDADALSKYQAMIDSYNINSQKAKMELGN